MHPIWFRNIYDSDSNRAICFDISAIFCVIFGMCLYIGYPILFPDSERYLLPVAELGVTENAPGLYPFLLRPLYLFIGPWAFVIANSLSLSVVSVCLVRYLYKHTFPVAIVLATLASAVFIYVDMIMMDIQVLFGVIALYLLSKRYAEKGMALIVFISLISHSSSLLVMLGVFLIILFFEYNKRFLIYFGLILTMSLSLLFWHNYTFSNYASPSSNNSKLFLMGRLMADYPQSVDTYLQSNPDSVLAKHWSDFRSSHSDQIKNRNVGIYLWGGQQGLFNRAGREKVQAEAKKYVFHVTRNHFLGIAKGSLINTWDFLSFSPSVKIVFNYAFVRDKRFAVKYASRFFPQQKEAMMLGAQYNSKIPTFYSESITIVVFLVSILFCLLLPLLYLFKRGQISRPVYFEMPILALTFIVLNALIMSNLGGIYGRYQLKVIYFPVLIMFVYFAHFLESVWLNLAFGQKLSSVQSKQQEG